MKKIAVLALSGMLCHNIVLKASENRGLPRSASSDSIDMREYVEVQVEGASRNDQPPLRSATPPQAAAHCAAQLPHTPSPRAHLEAPAAIATVSQLLVAAALPPTTPPAAQAHDQRVSDESSGQPLAHSAMPAASASPVAATVSLAMPPPPPARKESARSLDSDCPFGEDSPRVHDLEAPASPRNAQTSFLTQCLKYCGCSGFIDCPPFSSAHKDKD